jgi:hypothetical protein
MLKKTAVIFELVPVPRQISSECGVCIKSTEPITGIFASDGPAEVDRCYVYDGREYVLIEIGG